MRNVWLRLAFASSLVLQTLSSAQEIPQFSRPGGLITHPFDLELSNDTPDGEIRITLDGSVPTEESTPYTGPLSIAESTEVRARVFVAGMGLGPVKSESYLLLDPELHNFSSDVRVVVIDSFGFNINRESGTEENRPPFPRRPVYTVFLAPGENGRTALTDLPDFVGRGGMKVRGNSSRGLPKKQYSLETWDEDNEDRKVSIFGMPRESDWVFHAPYADKTLMRNHLAYKWWNDLGRYAVRTRFVEVFYNYNDGVIGMGDYAGVYVFMEKIKRDKNRLDITEMTPADNAEPEITGGYSLKVDVADFNETDFETPRGNPPDHPWNGFIILDPKPEDITQAQEAWLKNYIFQFEDVLYGPDYQDPNTGYAKYIDVPSFVDYFLFTELVKNGDGYYASVYMHKERGQKLAMGPVWDFNVCLGNYSIWDCENPEGWIWNRVQNFWFPILLKDPEFMRLVSERWKELRTDLWTVSNLLLQVDEVAASLNESQARNFERWNVLGRRVYVNPPSSVDRDTYQKEVDWMKGWLRDRLSWIDEQFIRVPEFSVPSGRVEPSTEIEIFNPEGEGEIVYTITTDGVDPKRPNGGLAPGARIYQGPITLSDNAWVKARVRKRGTDGSTMWSNVAEAVYSVNVLALAITEIMYNPPDGNDFEFIELFNFGDEPVPMQGITLAHGIEFEFTEDTLEMLEAGEYAVLVENLEAFTSHYDTQDITIAGEFAGALGNRRDTLTMRGPEGEPFFVFSFEYDDDWYPETDGDGHSLVLLDPLSPAGTWSEAAAWQPSELVGGSPGKADSEAPPSHGAQMPGDGNQDGKLNFSDTIHLLSYLFRGTVDALPCGDGSPEHAANLALLDINGDSTVDAADAIYNLVYLFLGGEPPVQGRECLEVADCPEACAR